MKVRELIERLNDLVEAGYQDTEIFYDDGRCRMSVSDIEVIGFLECDEVYLLVEEIG